ncbi:hypothetical protein PUN28_012040 [Cardiocondyla obscurior]|uniref:Uncharacterized protein n=1 Tax=Cardiocondyla obscurior TaxID=286306 RepID=A0AAW2FBR8_9HYME
MSDGSRDSLPGPSSFSTAWNHRWQRRRRGKESDTSAFIDSTLALKEGPTRHSADILRGGRGPGRASCIGGATFSHRQNSRTPLKLMQDW